MSDIICPCGSKKNALDCCVGIIKGLQTAHTAEQLMRSRYVAFTLANADYLLSSHHSKTRPVKEKNQIQQWAKSVTWAGLTILQTHNGKANDTTGMVEFQALYFEKGRMERIHERSLFERENGIWVYVSGIHK